MFGFFIGIACLWGLVRVIRGPRWGRRWGGWSGGGWSGGGCHARGCDGGGDWDGDRSSWGDRGRGWGGPAIFLRGLFRRLDTTPGQEKEIQAVVQEVMDAGRALKHDVMASRQEIGDAFRGDVFDAELMASLLTRHDDRIDELRQAMVGGLARLHGTLDPDQRRQLARVLEQGPRWAGPYRRPHAAV